MADRRAPDTIPYRAADDLAAVRAFVRTAALAFGLPGPRVDQLTLAVSELTTNTLQHTTGGGQVRLWSEPGHLFCDVVDGAPPLSFGPMPPPESVRGRGLAIVSRVADEVVSASGPDGTLVRIRMNL
jgi:serine/threonine-protein kinase RsbW